MNRKEPGSFTKPWHAGHSIIVGPNNQEMPRMTACILRKNAGCPTEYAEIEERAHRYKDADE